MFQDFDWNKLFESEDKSNIKETAKAIKETGAIARKCLTQSDFQLYRTKYEDLEKKVIDYMIGKARSFNGDASKLGSEMLAVLVKIDTLRSLLKNVESDSKKGINDEKL